MSDKHDYYSDQCSGCKWAEWRGGCLNKATAEDGSDLDAADRGECAHFEAGEPQKRPPQPGDRLHVQMPLDDYSALRVAMLAATARAEAAEQRAAAAERLSDRYGVFVQECGFLADIEVYSPDDLPLISEWLGALRARAEAAEKRAEALAADAQAAAHFCQSVAHMLASPGAEAEAVQHLRADDLPHLFDCLRERLAEAQPAEVSDV